MARKDVDIQKFCYHVNVTSHFSSLSRTDFVYRYIHTYSTPLFKALIHRVALKSYNINLIFLRKENDDTKERKERKSKGRKGKKKRKRKSIKRKGQVNGLVSKERETLHSNFL